MRRGIESAQLLRRYGRGILGFVLTAAVLRAAPAVAALPLGSRSSDPPAGRWQNVSIEEYRKHLVALGGLVDACARARDMKSCDPLLVGPDDRVPLGGQRRLVRYGWLRVLFSRAEESDQQTAPLGERASKRSYEPGNAPAPPTTSQLLMEAKGRLAVDLAQLDSEAGARSPDHAAERSTMEEVLAGRDFRDLEQASLRDTLMERVNNWLNRILESATRLRARSAWIGRLLVGAFIAAVCVALVWGLLQLERRWRVRLVREARRSPAAGAASARDWQLWLEDARRAAASGLWREAIHLVYWACISRLESRRMWPADRARTPREYLALVAADDPRRERLAALTGSFERTWYGARPAGEGDYRRVEEIAAALIGESLRGGPGGSSALAESARGGPA